MTATRIETTLPGGGNALIVMESDTIAVGVHDGYAIAHRRWMTSTQLAELRTVIDGLLR